MQSPATLSGGATQFTVAQKHPAETHASSHFTQGMRHYNKQQGYTCVSINSHIFGTCSNNRLSTEAVLKR